MVEKNNRDYLKRETFPKQTYAFSGIDYGSADSATRVAGKLNISKAPMIITPMPPGALARKDSSWSQTFGASMDCVMSLLDGKQYAKNVIDVNVEFISKPSYKKGLPTADNSNLYRVVGGKQQIHFIVGKSSVPSFRTQGATATFGIDARSLGIRAPIQMCGWGKTITMRPTDPEPLDKRVNDDAHLFDRSTWKTGPLDARWDERRKVWRAFNDLITDDRGENLGTFVYSTNPDDACGFPFLRAKLEDIWSVRRTVSEMGTEFAAHHDDTTKTATLVTKLSSYAIQGSNDNAAIGSWADVLSIVSCETGGLDGGWGLCGDEETTHASMAIQTSANWSVLGFGTGPIDFSLLIPAQNIKLGEMYFDGDVCGNGKWRPGIAMTSTDVCEAGADQFSDVWDNDINLADAVVSLLDQLQIAFDNLNFNLTDNLGGALKEDILVDAEFATTAGLSVATVSAAFTTIEDWSKTFAAIIEAEILNTVANAIGSVNGAIASAVTDTYDAAKSYTDALIDDLISQLSACLGEECVLSRGSGPEVGLFPPTAGVIPPSINPLLLLSPLIQALDIDSVNIVQFGAEYLAIKVDETFLVDGNEPTIFEIDFDITHPCEVLPPEVYKRP